MSTCPTSGVPEMVGGIVLTGGVAVGGGAVTIPVGADVDDAVPAEFVAVTITRSRAP